MKPRAEEGQYVPPASGWPNDKRPLSMYRVMDGKRGGLLSVSPAVHPQHRRHGMAKVLEPPKASGGLFALAEPARRTPRRNGSTK